MKRADANFGLDTFELNSTALPRTLAQPGSQKLMMAKVALVIGRPGEPDDLYVNELSCLRVRK